MAELKELNLEKSKSLLNYLLEDFKNEIKLTPVMATELEFFFIPKNANTAISESSLKELTDSISSIAENNGINIGNLSQETGYLQYEVNLDHSDEIEKLAYHSLEIKNLISNIANSYDLTTSFDAKPYGDDDVGSGFHVHLSLQDNNKKNCFIKHDNIENELLLNSIAGLLLLLPASILFFISNSADFKRYKAKFNIPTKEMRYRCNATNAPINISWGTNNRTTAIRIPDSHQNPQERRIEHRVPACNANPYLAIVAILFAVKYGITNKLIPQDRTWGNAFDEQYHLKSLPLNLKEAIEYYKKSELCKYIESKSA